jgi:lipoate-protein ligase A
VSDARVWRLVLDGPRDGGLNMALDRVLLERRAAGPSPPTLRLYSWSRPTVSLGRFQPVSDVDDDACTRRGFDVVRRPTGGRGVLHDDEVTYAVVAATSDGVPRGVAASYRLLSAALAEAYRSLGVPAELTSRSRGRAGAGACYMHATQADLSLGAAKLSGSAQLWHGDAVLQHGSFVISRDVEAEAEVLRVGEDGARQLARAAVTLEDALGARPSPGEVAAAAVRGFENALGVTLRPGELTPAELEEASERAEADPRPA